MKGNERNSPKWFGECEKWKLAPTLALILLLFLFQFASFSIDCTRHLVVLRFYELGASSLGIYCACWEFVFLSFQASSSISHVWPHCFSIPFNRIHCDVVLIFFSHIHTLPWCTQKAWAVHFMPWHVFGSMQFFLKQFNFWHDVLFSLAIETLLLLLRICSPQIYAFIKT